MDYCEASVWAASLFVPHDIDGLAQLRGGKEKLLENLDALFAAPSRYSKANEKAYWGGAIHEMAEMAEVDFGQCAISNQPSFHIPWLYAALNRPDKTDYWVGRISRELFSSADDGFPGDEDNGCTAAWYIFAMLGLYPLCPGKAEYVKGKMLVKTAKINGKDWHGERFGAFINHQGVI